jgi:uncharacterized membrane protein YheB (UPF0754 family)
MAALTGWLLVAAGLRLLFRPYTPKKIAGFRFQGILTARQQAIAAKLGALSAAMLSVKEIEEKITHPDNVKKIMPQAEEQIDHFLRVKLVKTMPVVGMFVGDKTINSLKALFITELEQLFPEIMKNYMGRLQEDFNIEQLVSTKIAAIPPAEIEKAVLEMMKKEWRLIKLFGAFTGFVIGCIQLIMLLLLR